MRLLYVEDEDYVREQISAVLRLKIKDVFVAKDGLEALEIFKNNKIDFIISDYKMPRMNGNELCKEVKKINKNVPFILLTAFHETDILIEAIDVGVDKFLRKPIDAKKLFEVLDEMNEKFINACNVEKSYVCIKEAEKIAYLSYWSANYESKEIHFSKEAFELFQLTKGSYLDLANQLHIDDKEKFIELFRNDIFKNKELDTIVGLKNGNFIRIKTKKWESQVCDDDQIVGIFQDVTIFEKEKITLINEIHQDPMLGIANKRFLLAELKRIINLAKRYGNQVGVIFFDIDDFKKVNDTYGHFFADDILKEFANLIQSHIRESDVFGRWGGDEFVIITPNSSAESVKEFMQKLVKLIESYEWKDNVKITISAGLAFYEDETPEELITKADKKMYEAKQSGKNGFSY